MWLPQPLRHRTRAERRWDKRAVTGVWVNCRAGLKPTTACGAESLLALHVPAWSHLCGVGTPNNCHEGLSKNSPPAHMPPQGRDTSPKERMPHSIFQDEPGAGAAWCCQSRRKTAISSLASPVPATAHPKGENGKVGRCPCLSLPSALLPRKWLHSRLLPKERSSEWGQLCQDLMRTKVGGPYHVPTVCLLLQGCTGSPQPRQGKVLLRGGDFSQE